MHQHYLQKTQSVRAIVVLFLFTIAFFSITEKTLAVEMAPYLGTPKINTTDSVFHIGVPQKDLELTYFVYNLPENVEAAVSISIVDGNGKEIFSFPVQKVGNGTYTLPWNGLINNQYITPGKYLFKLRATYPTPPSTAAMGDAYLPFGVEGKPFSMTVLTVNKNPYDPLAGEPIAFSYYLNATDKDALYDRRIFCEIAKPDTIETDLKVVHEFEPLSHPTSGTISLSWDGKDMNTGAYVIDSECYLSVKKENYVYTDSDYLEYANIPFIIARSDAPALLIKDFGLSNGAFSPALEEFYGSSSKTITLTFWINLPANITLSIRDTEDNEVRKEILTKPAGTVTYTWDGKDQNGQFVPTGNYTMTVKAITKNGLSAEDSASVGVDNIGVPGPCTAFTDVSPMFCDVFTFAKEKGIFLGDGNAEKTTVRPWDIINRAEAAAVIMRALKLKMLPGNGTNEGFIDADPMAWYMLDGTVRSAKSYDILRGYPDRTLKPWQAVSKAEFITMLVRAAKLQTPFVTEPPYADTPLLPEHTWYLPALNLAKKEGWLSSYQSDSFYPSDGMTRVDVGILLQDAYNSGLKF